MTHSVLPRLFTSILPALGLMTVLTCVRAHGAELTEQFSDRLGPQVEHDGVILHLVSFSESKGALHANITVANDSNGLLELPAVDWKPIWLHVEQGGALAAASLSFTDPDDAEQHWPDVLPLRRTVTIQPYHSVTYFVDCIYVRSDIHHPGQPSLILHGLLGNDRKPITVTLPIPASPDAVSAADVIGHANASP